MATESAAERRTRLLSTWQASQAISMRVAAVSQLGAESIQLPDSAIQLNRAVVCCCTCGHDMCLRVVKFDTMRRRWPGPRCPAHDKACATYSAAVKHFHEIVQCMQCFDKVIWDWHDIPECPGSHIDATVLLGDVALRFEIDGRSHFSQQGTQRLDSDESKDAVLTHAGMRVTRLHVDDVDSWHEVIQHTASMMLFGDTGGVAFTAAYVDCVPALML